MSKTVIANGKTLGAFLDSVISESVAGAKAKLHHKALDEKDKQAAQAGSQAPSSDGGGSTDLFGGDDSGSDGGSQDGDNEQSKTGSDAEDEKLKDGDIDPKDIIDKLNSIRSGKSFKDSAVKGSMEEYIESLSKPEKVAMLAFLKGIAQIVTGEVAADQAIEPDSNPANVEMSKGEQKSMKSIQPNVIKAVPQKKAAATGGENTSSPVPITPKRK